MGGFRKRRATTVFCHFVAGPSRRWRSSGDGVRSRLVSWESFGDSNNNDKKNVLLFFRSSELQKQYRAQGHLRIESNQCSVVVVFFVGTIGRTFIAESVIFFLAIDSPDAKGDPFCLDFQVKPPVHSLD